jgi:hypothetical protein
MIDPFDQEPDVTPTIKCPGCGETLLFSRKSCQYCGEEIDFQYAIRSRLQQTALTRACSWANNLRTTNVAMVVIALLMIVSSAGSNGRTLTPLILSLSYCCAVGLWCWRYADLEVDDSDFAEAKRTMKRYLHRWLAFCALQIFLLLIRLYR